MCGRCGTAQTIPPAPPSTVGVAASSGYPNVPTSGGLAAPGQLLPGVTVTATRDGAPPPWWVWLLVAVVVGILAGRR